MRYAFVAIIAALTAIPASAEPSKHFQRSDLNGDGFIDNDEFFRTQQIEYGQFFVFADRENDGRLDPSEYESLLRKAARRFQGGND